MSMYTTISETNTYFETRLHTDAWDEASTTERTAALTMATEAIDRLNFLGKMAEDDQELQFPRDEDTDVPNDIKKACSEIALALLDGVEPEMEFENLGLVSQGYSNVRSTYDRSRAPEHIVAGIPSITAWRYLKPYLRDYRSVQIHRVS